MIKVLLIIGAAVVGPIEPLGDYTKCVLSHGELSKMTNEQNVACTKTETEITLGKASDCFIKAEDSGFNTNGYYSVWGPDKRGEWALDLPSTRDFWLTRCVNLYARKPETVAQTCARAMKEIGAYKVEHYKVGKVIFSRGYFKAGTFASVRCIPAPSGLR